MITFDLGNGKCLSKVGRSWAEWIVHPAPYNASTITNEDCQYDDQLRVLSAVDIQGELWLDTDDEEEDPNPYRSGLLRAATVEEVIASLRAAKTDGGVGRITVDGQRCYVEKTGCLQEEI